MEENLYPNILITHVKKIFHILENKFPLLKYSFTNSPPSFNLTELESVPEELKTPGKVKYKYPDGKIEYIEHDKPIQIVLKQFCQYLLYLDNNDFEYDENNKRLAKNIFLYYGVYSIYLKGEKYPTDFDLLLAPENLLTYKEILPNFKCRLVKSEELPIFSNYYQFINIYKFLYCLSEYIKNHTIFTFATLVNYNKELLVLYIFTVINFNMMKSSIINDLVVFLKKHQDKEDYHVLSLILILIAYFYDKYTKIFCDISFSSEDIFCFDLLFCSKFLRNVLNLDFRKEGIPLEDINIFTLFFYERSKGCFQCRIAYNPNEEINEISAKNSLYLLNKVKNNSLVLTLKLKKCHKNILGYPAINLISNLFENLRIMFFSKLNYVNNSNKSFYVLPSSCEDLMKKPNIDRLKDYYSFEIKSHYEICKFLLIFPLSVLKRNKEIVKFFVENTKEYLKEFIYYIKEYGPKDHPSSFSITFYSKYNQKQLPDFYTKFYFDVFFIKQIITCRTSFKFEDYVDPELNIFSCLNEVIDLPIYLLNEKNLNDEREENVIKIQFFIKILVLRSDINFNSIVKFLKEPIILRTNQLNLKFDIRNEDYKLNNNIESFTSLITSLEFLRDIKRSDLINKNLIINLSIITENLDLKIILKNKLEDCILEEFSNSISIIDNYYICLKLLKDYLSPRRIIQKINSIKNGENNKEMILRKDFINNYNYRKIISIKYVDESEFANLLETLNKDDNFNNLTLELFDFHETYLQSFIEKLEQIDKIERLVFFHSFDIYESIYIFERVISYFLNAKNPKYIVYNLFIEDPGNENSFKNLMECSQKVFKNDKYFEMNYHNYKDENILSYCKNPIFNIYSMTITRTQIYTFNPEMKITSDFIPKLVKYFHYFLYVMYRNKLLNKVNKKPILNILLKFLRTESGMKFSLLENN